MLCYAVCVCVCVCRNLATWINPVHQSDGWGGDIYYSLEKITKNTVVSADQASLVESGMGNTSIATSYFFKKFTAYSKYITGRKCWGNAALLLLISESQYIKRQGYVVRGPRVTHLSLVRILFWKFSHVCLFLVVKFLGRKTKTKTELFRITAFNGRQLQCDGMRPAPYCSDSSFLLPYKHVLV